MTRVTDRVYVHTICTTVVNVQYRTPCNKKTSDKNRQADTERKLRNSGVVLPQLVYNAHPFSDKKSSLDQLCPVSCIIHVLFYICIQIGVVYCYCVPAVALAKHLWRNCGCTRQAPEGVLRAAAQHEIWGAQQFSPQEKKKNPGVFARCEKIN